MYNQDAVSDAVSKIVHEILAHASNPVHGDEVTIPLLIEMQPGIELIRSVAMQLRGHRENVWISSNGQTMIHKQIRVYVDATAMANPIAVRGETSLMCVISRHTELSRYGQGVLADTLNNSLMSARFAGYQGHIIALKSEDAAEDDGD